MNITKIIAVIRAFFEHQAENALDLVHAIEPSPAGDEPSFTLTGDDPLASALVREWAERAERAGVNRPKVQGALSIADRMDHMDPSARFTLRAKDVIASSIVQMWIQRATARRVAPSLIAAAETQAEAMALFSPKKIPD